MADQRDDQAADVLSEPEAMPDDVRSTDDPADLDAAVQEEEAERPPQGT